MAITGVFDAVIAYQFVKMISQPFDEWEAYEMGIIDEDGKSLRKRSTLKSQKEKNAFTTFHVMVRNLKLIMSKLPGGKSKLMSFAAALYLLKEDRDTDLNRKELHEELNKLINSNEFKMNYVEFVAKEDYLKEDSLEFNELDINFLDVNYLEDLLTCVHITQLKSLTSSRVGLKQKKVDIDIPNLNSFIHKAYINVARKIYVNVYLFEKDVMPLQIQKNNRELEIIVKECLLNTVRENIPVENILRIYLDETLETDVQVEETREIIADENMIKKQAKEKELEKAKQEVKEKIQKESKQNLSEAIKNANKSFNSDNNEIVSKQIGEENEIDYETEDERENPKLNLGSNDDGNLELDIKTLDTNDPDELDLQSLDIKADDSLMDLDIMELK